jgi:glycosyltransferase involved in cell wall biosynthesis
MLSGRNIVCVSTIDWRFLWQAHQGVMSVFARAGNRVLFIENTGVRSAGWRDAKRITMRLEKWLSGEGRFRLVAENIFLYSPLALPFPYSRLAQRINRALVPSSIRRWLERNRFDDPILFTFLPTQFTLDLMDTIDPRLSIFYCMDKLSETSPEARHIVPYERRVLERCDLVFASSDRLVDHCRAHNPNVHLFCNGVSLEKFERAWLGETAVPEDIARLPRPVIGYVGGLHRYVDQPLLRQLSERMPHATLALVGPQQVPANALRVLPNVHLLGPRPHARIPDYVYSFDACIIPYVVNNFTSNVSPAKLNEYLALGKPVVSTNLPEVRRFNERYGGVVATAATPADFVLHLEEALQRDTQALRRSRRAVAERNSWESRVEAMSRVIDAAMRLATCRGAGHDQ